jgi:hypothetical protein
MVLKDLVLEYLMLPTGLVLEYRKVLTGLEYLRVLKDILPGYLILGELVQDIDIIKELLKGIIISTRTGPGIFGSERTFSGLFSSKTGFRECSSKMSHPKMLLPSEENPGERRGRHGGRHTSSTSLTILPTPSAVTGSNPTSCHPA